MADVSTSFGWISAVFNLLAVIVLLFALIPPYLDAKNKKMTFGIGFNFLFFYITGGLFVFFMSTINILGNKVIKGTPSTMDAAWFAIFCLFIIINCISVYINTKIVFMKKQNIKIAKENGMDEREYWETHVKDTLGTVNNPANNA